MRIFIDANVLLDVVLERQNFISAAQALRELPVTPVISTLTIHLVMHFGLRERKIDILRKFLADFEVLNLDKVDAEWAFNNMRDKDFEDALQLAVAIRNGCERFVTFDAKLYKYYKDLVAIEVKLLK